MSLTVSSPSEIACLASVVSRQLGTLPVVARNNALTAIHSALSQNKERILRANAEDVQHATKAVNEGKLSQSVLKRLDLSRPGKYDEMLRGILDVRDLEDPLGKLSLRTLLDDGLILERVSCPIGVLLIIFEARPEVIANIAALSIKSGNAAILKGGKESIESFKAIAHVVSDALSSTDVPNAAIQLVESRDVILPLLAQDREIDLVIPRGSNELVRFIKANTKIPVLGHADGLCSIYLRGDADVSMARSVIVDAKTNYPAACNAVETLLVDEEALHTLLPPVAEALIAEGVTLRCDKLSNDALQGRISPAQAAYLQQAKDSDYDTEFLDLIIAVKTISATASLSTLDVAMSHINAHSSKHTDVILTSSKEVAERFLLGVDSAGVYWNASSRMADGMRYGFGTEVGISTNKIHSRGPVGLEGLTIYKYLIRGNGHTAGEFQGDGGKQWKHKELPTEDE
ncbi:glutamate-5-semialdehyde dehydrogenase [Ophidiomyces ophidiicola]|uniref:Glutamate-5-semialdehyde dehydrogenase n=1 Tax=Ophidiomyces ophidiicola TaxID=1387563 RepID=A0ACB8UV40_9EURO|nr:glutamate-5-semialdehyde dehydrogenase [Ophidiomyces ophidiicola]KAI1945689.1 glutamate-5-semialdehyde dehydrogenase [Ophidiomyces ophidiicola]KAI1977098.1 glutamate-5-semialdehyde dehydrogenase [Ophidiomyces ophidiicola]KAI1989537.1 glutamate-5-semialdehyde dehydrogenase [Ophidiomyces ophidiicola]KAI1993354.1 glutamate-5-semialdehyde dehydrogenase [Ophidiomyces ophidiicola]